MRNGPGGGFGRRAIARRRSAVLHYDAINARGISSPQNCPEIVRILDAVEDDEQRGPEAPRTSSSTL